jgi:hypothetical protein
MHGDEGKKRGGCRKADIEESERSNATVVLSHTIKQAAKNSTAQIGRKNPAVGQDETSVRKHISWRTCRKKQEQTMCSCR